MPQAPKSKKIIFWFKCRLKQQCGAFTSIRQSIYPKLLKQQRCKRGYPCCFKAAINPQSHWSSR
ncbi:hypothetical protein CBW57_16850 [Yersinia intermedia]|uniref:Uncharacterized protein n=1 Tax=Yersinia intermedia TaxID=631 RepID=A0A208ZUY4_YERIN|nr:hypothetical protein CBW57_16850 [Yersinia intermedia]